MVTEQEQETQTENNKSIPKSNSEISLLQLLKAEIKDECTTVEQVQEKLDVYILLMQTIDKVEQKMASEALYQATRHTLTISEEPYLALVEAAEKAGTTPEFELNKILSQRFVTTEERLNEKEKLHKIVSEKFERVMDDMGKLEDFWLAIYEGKPEAEALEALQKRLHQ